MSGSPSRSWTARQLRSCSAIGVAGSPSPRWRPHHKASTRPPQLRTKAPQPASRRPPNPPRGHAAAWRGAAVRGAHSPAAVVAALGVLPAHLGDRPARRPRCPRAPRPLSAAPAREPRAARGGRAHLGDRLCRALQAGIPSANCGGATGPQGRPRPRRDAHPRSPPAHGPLLWRLLQRGEGAAAARRQRREAPPSTRMPRGRPLSRRRPTPSGAPSAAGGPSCCAASSRLIPSCVLDAARRCASSPSSPSREWPRRSSGTLPPKPPISVVRRRPAPLPPDLRPLFHALPRCGPGGAVPACPAGHGFAP